MNQFAMIVSHILVKNFVVDVMIGLSLLIVLFVIAMMSLANVIIALSYIVKNIKIYYLVVLTITYALNV
jgi:hypothetical protein